MIQVSSTTQSRRDHRASAPTSCVPTRRSSVRCARRVKRGSGPAFHRQVQSTSRHREPPADKSSTTMRHQAILRRTTRADSARPRRTASESLQKALSRGDAATEMKAGEVQLDSTST